MCQPSRERCLFRPAGLTTKTPTKAAGVALYRLSFFAYYVAFDRSKAMRSVFFPAYAVVCLVGALQGDEPAPSYYSTDLSLSKIDDKVAGHIGACMVGQSNKPRICFGLNKEIDGDARFTFLVLFRTGKRNCKPSAV